jgi:hypothetical protein
MTTLGVFAPGYHTAAETIGAGPNRPASANYSALQTALNGRGMIKLTEPGTYDISDTLVIYDNTWLELGNGVRLRMQGGANKRLIKNSALEAATAPVTLTYASGITMTVNWPLHGLALGDVISIANVTPVSYAGIYEVAAVPDANSVTVLMHRLPGFSNRVSVTNASTAVTLEAACPLSLVGYSLVTNDAATIYTVSAHTAGTAAVTLSGSYTGTTSTNFTRRGTFTKAPVAVSGSIEAKRCNVGIEIEGGTWDYNRAGGNTSSDQNLDRHVIVLGFLARSKVHNVTGVDATKYIVCLGAALNVEVDGVDAPNHTSDIVKLYGPSKGCVVRNVTGVSGDDAVSLQTKEPDAFAGYRFAFGDVLDCDVTGVRARATGGQGVLTLYGSNEELMSGITARQITGYVNDNSAVLVVGIGSGFIGRYGTVRASGIRGMVSGATGAAVRLIGTGSGEADIEFDDIDVTCINGIQTQTNPLVRSLLISRLVPRDLGTAGDPINLNGITAQSVVIDRNQFDFLTPSTTKYCISAAGTSNIANLQVTRCVNRSNWFFAALDCALRDVLFGQNENHGSSDHFVRLNSATGTPTVRFADNATNTLAVCNPNVSCALYFSGNRVTGATNGVVRTGGTPTVAIRSEGNNLVSGSWVVVPSGTPVLTVYGWDIAIDPITLTGLAATLGQYCSSTQATVENGPSVRGNAGWCALGGGAAGVNTLIT